MKVIKTASILFCGFIVILIMASWSPGSVAQPLPSLSAQPLSSDIVSHSTGKFFVPYVANEFNNAIGAQTNCRYGASATSSQDSNLWMTTVGAGHYVNFHPVPMGPPVTENVEFLPMVRIKQDHIGDEYLPTYTVTPPLTMEQGGLGPFILSQPNRLWIVGNEPDVPQVQDDMLPEKFAEAYHEIYHFIKGIDPSAHVSPVGLSMITPGRLQYMDIMWDSYIAQFGEQMPVDAWNIHLYILAEIRPWDMGPSDGKLALGTDPALAVKAPNGPPSQECPKNDVYCRAEHDSISIFQQQVLAMRTWMKQHGQQDRPLLLTEYSVLYPFLDWDDPINPTQCYLQDEFGGCFTEERVADYLENTINYLEQAVDPALGYPADGHRLVQQWTWYAMHAAPTDIGGSSTLLRADYLNYPIAHHAALTEVGDRFRESVANTETTVNLVAGETLEATVEAGEDGLASATIGVGFYNNGTGYVATPFIINFYADETRDNLIARTTVTPNTHGLINGCSWGRTTDWQFAEWEDLSVGTHEYWARVDTFNYITGEVSEQDNVIKGQVTVLPAP